MLLQLILLEELILYTLCAPIADTVSAVGAVSPAADAVSAIEETASTADTLAASTNDTVPVSVHNHSPKGRAQRQRKRERQNEAFTAPRTGARKRGQDRALCCDSTFTHMRWALQGYSAHAACPYFSNTLRPCRY